jgi:hypothetical protein
MLKSLIVNDGVVENIISGVIPGAIECPEYEVRIGYKFNTELQLYLRPEMTTEEFNATRNLHIEKLNEIATWYATFLESSHFAGLTTERKAEIQLWVSEKSSIIPTEIEKLTNDNSYAINYGIPFLEILDQRPNIEFEV